MAVNNRINDVSYGLTNALQDVFPAPIVSTRAATASDLAQIGQMWVNKTLNTVHVLTSVVAGQATWTIVS